MATRAYEQRMRAQTAEETRRRILVAVYDQLRSKPSEPVSLDRVAQAAGVSRSTVYLIFESRAGLFNAVAADLLEQGGFRQMMRATTHADALEGLRGVIRAGVRMFAAHRDVLRALFSMAALDAEAVGGSIQRMEKHRAQGVADRVRRLAEGGFLRCSVTVEEASDLLWVLTSFDTFDLLYAGRRLSVDRIAKSLITTAERTLCA